MSALKLANGIEDVPGFSQFLHCPKIKEKLISTSFRILVSRG
jgi:hypothetical protein